MFLDATLTSDAVPLAGQQLTADHSTDSLVGVLTGVLRRIGPGNTFDPNPKVF